MIFLTNSQNGIGFNPTSFFGPVPIRIDIYDTSNVLLGTANADSTPYAETFFGVQSFGGTHIGRLNLCAPDGGTYEGADNIEMWRSPDTSFRPWTGGGNTDGASAVPEPTSIFAIGLGLVVLTVRRRRSN